MSYAEPLSRGVLSAETGGEKTASYALYALLLLMTLGPLLSISDMYYTGDGNPIRQFGYVAIYLMSLAALGTGAMLKQFFPLPLGLVVVFLWCGWTLQHSLNPGVWSRRPLLTLFISLTIFSMTRLSGYERTVGIVKRVSLGILVANWVTVLLLPRVGIHRMAEVAGFGASPDIIGAQKGIVAHKNYARSLCAFTILLYALDEGRTSLLPRLMIICSASVFLISSHSKTSGALVVLAIILEWLYRTHDARFRIHAVAIILAAFMVVAIIVDLKLDSIRAFIRSPDGFTGRTAIWNTLLRYWSDHAHPAGFGSFWNIGGDIQMLHYVKAKDWLAGVPEAHNGYIDLLVQVGMPGLVLTIIALVVIPVFKLVWSPTVSRSKGAVALAMIVFSAGHNFTESSFLDRDQIVDVFLFFAVALTGVLTAPAASARQAYRLWRLKDPSLA